MYKALYLSPLIPSFNMTETISFFTDLLDFIVARSETSYAILNKDNLTIHILNAGTDIGQWKWMMLTGLGRPSKTSSET